jgi:hypothetical protein
MPIDRMMMNLQNTLKPKMKVVPMRKKKKKLKKNLKKMTKM